MTPIFYRSNQASQHQKSLASRMAAVKTCCTRRYLSQVSHVTEELLWTPT